MWRHACWMWRDSVVRAQTAKRRTKRPESWQGTRWISLLLVILFSKSWFSSLEPWEDRGSSSCLQQPDFNWVKLLLMLHFTLFARCLRDLYIYSTLLPISHAETSYNVNFNCHLITHLDCYSMCPFNHLNNISTMRMKYCTSLIEKCVTSWYTIFNIISVTYGHQLSSANKNKHWADRGVKNFFFFFFFQSLNGRPVSDLHVQLNWDLSTRWGNVTKNDMVDVVTFSLKQTSPMMTSAQTSNLLSARTRLSNSLARPTCCNKETYCIL